MTMRLILALVLISFLSACGGNTNTVSAEQQKLNAAAVATLKEDSVLVCSSMGKAIVAMHVQSPDQRNKILRGYIIKASSVDFNGRQETEPFVATCGSIRIFTNPAESAEIIGRLVLGLPS